MPKHKAKNGAARVGGKQSHPQHPYHVDDKPRPASATASPTADAPSTSTDMSNGNGNEGGSGKRKRKNRPSSKPKQTGDAAPASAASAQPPASSDDTAVDANSQSHHPNGQDDVTDEIAAPMTNGASSSSRDSSIAASDSKSGKPFLKDEVAELKALLQAARDQVSSINEAMHMFKTASQLQSQNQVQAVRAEMALMKTEMETAMSTTTKLLADQTAHLDKVKETVSCGVCFEPLDDPHALTCGHTACRKCLVQWFRSANAYRSENIHEVFPNQDLTYRTKVCHMCREPIYRRPVRMFALQSVIDTLGIAHPTPERDEDPWRLTFPRDVTGYVLDDPSDNIDRCPCCLGEVAFGQCNSCGAEFSSDDDDDSDGEDLDAESEDTDSEAGSIIEFLDSDDDDDLVLNAARNALGLPPRRGATPPERARDVRRTFSPSQPPAMPSFLDDIADESGDDGSGDESGEDLEDPLPGRFNLDRDDDGSGSDGDGAVDDLHRDRLARRPFVNLPPPVLSSNYDSDSDSDSERSPHGRSRTPTLARRNDVTAADDDDLDLDEEEEYESSFISDGSVEMLSADEDSEAEVNGVVDGDDDAPAIDELRARRAARFGAGPGAPAVPEPEPQPEPASATTASRRRRRIVESDDED